MRINRFLALALLFATAGSSMGAADGKVIVSVPRLSASAGEVVTAFEIDATSGAFISVSNVPVGWYITLDNEPSWQTKIEGNIRVGSASLRPVNFSELHFTIEKHDIDDLNFDLSGTIVLTNGDQTERQLHLKMNDFKVTRG